MMRALLLVLALLAPNWAGAETLTYCGFQNNCRAMEVWRGEKVLVLSLPDTPLQPGLMARLVADYDRAWAAYERLVGVSPAAKSCCTIDGRATIAQSPDPDAVAAARGHIGGHGIELYHGHFARILAEYAASGRHDHIVFHEMGRNFWRWRAQVGALKPFEVGFAIANKFLVMDMAGLTGAPFRTMSFAQLRASLDETWTLYQTTPGLDWKGALVEGRLPRHPQGWGANDLAAALWWRIHQRTGTAGYASFFAALARQPQAATPEAAVANIIAAGKMVGHDLGDLFKGYR